LSTELESVTHSAKLVGTTLWTTLANVIANFLTTALTRNDAEQKLVFSFILKLVL
jgi:hypothetical protein